MPIGAWRHWWFWAALPVALVGFRFLDAALNAYCVRYWYARGESPPPQRYSSRLDAGSLVVYAAFVAAIAVALGVEDNFAWAGIAGACAVAIAWSAVMRARANVIGFTKPNSDADTD